MFEGFIEHSNAPYLNASYKRWVWVPRERYRSLRKFTEFASARTDRPGCRLRFAVIFPVSPQSSTPESAMNEERSNCGFISLDALSKQNLRSATTEIRKMGCMRVPLMAELSSPIPNIFRPVFPVPPSHIFVWLEFCKRRAM